jgi:hypothetical protein
VGRKLKYLGATLPMLSDGSSHLLDFTGPDHVVLEIPGVSTLLGARGAGAVAGGGRAAVYDLIVSPPW